MKNKKAAQPEGEQQQTAANFLASQSKSKKKPTSKTQLVVNVDKAKFETKEIPMSKNEKAAKKTKAPKTAGTRAKLEGKIVVLKKENPFREGTNRAIRLNLIFKSKSVEAALGAKEGKLSPSVKDIKRAASLKLIKIAA